MPEAVWRNVAAQASGARANRDETGRREIPGSAAIASAPEAQNPLRRWGIWRLARR